MAIYKTILMTVDLGEPASWKHAIPHAVDLARNSRAKLYVISVVPNFSMPIVGERFPPGYLQKMRQTAKAALEKLIADEMPPELEAKAILASGIMHEEILRAIKTTGADLVVMASHAPDRMREFLIGSAADRVARRSPVSVLVVRGT